MLLLSWLPVQASEANKLERAASEQSYTISSVSFHGFRRSQKDWALRYLGLSRLPLTLTWGQAQHLARRLLTTRVFSSVQAELALETPSRTQEKEKKAHLHFFCEEKWTSIPVLRAQLGGGTPLWVLGAYDIHSFGRLWTLGGELRKYGEAPAGSVLYAKAPRWLEGQHALGFEWWRDFRHRTLYSAGDEKTLGYLATYGSKLRLHFALPWPSLPYWQYGVDFSWGSHQKPKMVTFSSDKRQQAETAYAHIDWRNEGHQSQLAYATLTFDNMEVNNILYEGARGLLKAGGLQEPRAWQPAWEGELFYYALWGGDINLALHFFLGAHKSRSLGAQYYLGGFDSLRGLPDGLLFGNVASYSNTELRYLFLRLPSLWLQSAAFLDWGSAGPTFSSLNVRNRSSVGIGLRAAIPQVHRLMLRFDLAFDVSKPGRLGISAGLNQLFQPYRPL